MIKKIFLFVLLAFLALSAHADSFANQLRDGDIIFHASHSTQSLAIQKATHSKYSHMGIIFLRDGKPYVYEAIKTVQAKIKERYGQAVPLEEAVISPAEMFASEDLVVVAEN